MIDKTNKNELSECEQKAQEYLNNWERERADFINYKKAESERQAEFLKYANEELLLKLVNILDDLEIAVKQIENPGLEQVQKKFQAFLKHYGLEKIQIGKEFDPSLHEAVETEPDGQKLKEIRSGYTLHGRVVRPVRVRIVK